MKKNWRVLKPKEHFHQLKDQCLRALKYKIINLNFEVIDDCRIACEYETIILIQMRTEWIITINCDRFEPTISLNNFCELTQWI